MLEPLFNKVAGLQVSNFIKKKLHHRCFPSNIEKFLRTSFFENHLRTAASVATSEFGDWVQVEINVYIHHQTSGSQTSSKQVSFIAIVLIYLYPCHCSGKLVCLLKVAIQK